MIDVYIRATNQVDNVCIYHSEGSSDKLIHAAKIFAKTVSKYDRFIVDVWVKIDAKKSGGVGMCKGRYKEGKEL